MKKLVFFVMCAFLLAGCGTQNNDSVKNVEPTSSATERPKNEQEKTTEEVYTTTSDMFEIKNGVLVRYNGGYKKAFKIVLPETVKEIGSKAFSLTNQERKNVFRFKVSSIKIPPDVKLQENAFYGTGPLKVELLNGRTKVEKRAFSEMGKYGCELEISLGNSIKTIEEYAFYEENGTKKVNLNHSLERIEKYGLYGALHSDLPESIRYLGDNSLGYTKEQITKLPENLEYIGECCITLYNGRIKIPPHVKKIAINAVVWDCTNADVQGFDVDEKNQHYKSDANGWLYSKDGKTLYYAYRSGSENNLVIPKRVKKIFKYGIHMYDDDFAPGEVAKIIRK